MQVRVDGEQLFARRCKVLIASQVGEIFNRVIGEVIEIENLRVEFKVTKSLTKDPNTAEIKIYNLAESTRSSLQASGAKVILMAGYPDTIAQIWIGDARTIDHVRIGPDWVTKIDGGDGERAYLNSRISESFKGGVGIPKVVNLVAKKMGVGLGDVSQLSSLTGAQFSNGYALHGRCSKELDRILTAVGYEWSIQDGALQVLKGGAASLTEAIISLSEDSGLIGSPEYGTSTKKDAPPLVKAKSLLMPGLRPGGRVELASLKHSGVHRVIKVVHEGDTDGGHWYSEIEADVATS